MSSIGHARDVGVLDDRAERLAAGLCQTAIAAIGPVVAGELQRHGADATIMPAGSYFMKPLVTAIVEALPSGGVPAG